MVIKMKRWENNLPLTDGACNGWMGAERQECRTWEKMAESFPLLYPEEIREWISELKLLKGVPLSMLVGDEKQLPPESIRFFYLDENWTEQMINGAFSIGAGNDKAGGINRSFLGDFHLAGRQNIHQIRRRCIHENQLQFFRQNGDGLKEGSEITGFIMRSRLVRLWKGLESSATDIDGAELDILHMEQLSGEIMLCLFAGELAKLQIREPKEGLRFGASGNDRNINVRDVRDGEEGKPLPGKAVPIKSNDCGRADILALVKDLQKELGASKITSAQLAMELIIAPGIAAFHRQ